MRKKRAPMDGGERSNTHRNGSSGGGAGEFFICFTARTSSLSATPSASGSMRATSSKSLMSPGRGHDPSTAPPLSASFSRRLRRNGSVKGGQSPMFPAGVALTGRKKGCTFEPAEPSSPKVTCIGQVRVKAKKRVKSKAMARSRSQRWRARNNNQGGWVHQLPVSICEALRSIGSEFNCFLPCGGRSLCGGGGGGGGGGSNSSSRIEEEKLSRKKRMARSASSSSCGAVVARWLMAVQEREEEAKGGDFVGLVVEEREKVEVGFLLREREEHVGEVEVEEKTEMVVVGEKSEGGEEEAARVSVCIPPRNALLLMRCRSDPVKMAALANRFWGSPAAKLQCEEEHVKEEKEVVEDCDCKYLLEKEEGEAVEVSVVAGELVKEEVDFEWTAGEEKNTLMEGGDVSDKEEKLQLLREEVRTESEEISCEPPSILRRNSSKEENEETKGTHLLKEQEREEENAEKETKGCRGKEERRSGSICASRSKERGRRRGKEKDSRRHSFSSEMEARRHSLSLEREARRASFSIDRGRRWSFSIDKEESGSKEEAFTVSAVEASPEDEKKKEVTPEEEDEEEEVEASEETEREKPKYREEQQANGEGKHEAEAEEEKKGEAGKWTELPDCLLMMMYEPKLSMEVSKETWVCSNDFLRRPHNTRSRRPSKIEAAAAADSEAAECRTKEDGGDNATSAVQLPTAAASEAATPQDAPADVLVDPVAVSRRVPATQQHKVSAGAARQAAVVPYEPLVLTRCKSEPVRSSASLAPDASFWKDRHRPIGAAGIGF